MRYSLLNPEGATIREEDDLRVAVTHAQRISRRCPVAVVMQADDGERTVARFVRGRNKLPVKLFPKREGLKHLAEERPEPPSQEFPPKHHATW